MKRRVHPGVAVLSVLVLLVLGAILYSRSLPEADTGGAVMAFHARGEAYAPAHDSTLGVMWSPMPGRKGLKIMGFRPPPGPPPLPAVGFQRGDILVECNGEEFRPRALHAAVEELKERGRPFTVTVERGGGRKTITVTRWPAARVVAAEGERAPSGAARIVPAGQPQEGTEGRGEP